MDLSKYWNKRGKNYHKELENQSWLANIEESNQQRFISNFLKECSFKNILEIGCGNGRLTKYLVNILHFETITAIDISDELISQAKQNIKHPNVFFKIQDVLQFSYEKKFDLIFGGEILMHISPHDINNLIKNLITLCTGKLIFVEFYDPKYSNDSNKNYHFSHDYKLLFQKHGICNINIHLIKHSPIQKFINIYTKLRHRTPFSQQAIVEVNL